MFQKAVIKVTGGLGYPGDVQPTEYNLDTGANYSNINVPGMDGPITQYISGKQDTLVVS